MDSSRVKASGGRGGGGVEARLSCISSALSAETEPGRTIAIALERLVGERAVLTNSANSDIAVALGSPAKGVLWRVSIKAASLSRSSLGEVV